MEHLAPVGPVYQAGTLSGNPVAMAAGKKSLELATEEVYDIIRANADRLSGLIHDALTREGVTHHIQRAATMFSVRFAEGEGHNFADMKAADTFRFAPFFHALLDNVLVMRAKVQGTDGGLHQWCTRRRMVALR